VALAKKKKNKPVEESATARLNEIQSRGDQLSEWISHNPMPILAGAGAILAATALYVFAVSEFDGSRNQASTEIAAVKNEFRRAMGGAYAGSVDIPEPANPETARSTREEYIGRFRELAAAHEGTEMGGYALFQIATLQADLDDDESALASYQQALTPYAADEAMRGIILERIALLHEARGELEAATKSHLAASEIAGFPLRYFALLGSSDRELRPRHTGKPRPPDPRTHPGDVAGAQGQARALSYARPRPPRPPLEARCSDSPRV